MRRKDGKPQQLKGQKAIIALQSKKKSNKKKPPTKNIRDPYAEGYEAREAHKTRNDCPYQLNTMNYQLWLRGFDAYKPANYSAWGDYTRKLDI